MSKLIESCIELSQRSKFEIRETRFGIQMEISEACLLFPNFAGRSNKFGNESKNFNVVITPELAEDLRNKKLNGLNVNVHEYGKGTDEEPKLYYINVKVNMLTSFPPSVTLYVKSDTRQPSKTSLTDDTIACLDRIDMDRADVIINVKESRSREGWAVFYLNTLKVVQTKNSSFGGFYDDLDDPLTECNPEIEAANHAVMNDDKGTY